MSQRAVPVSVLQAEREQHLQQKERARRIREEADAMDREADSAISFLERLLTLAVEVGSPGPTPDPSPDHPGHDEDGGDEGEDDDADDDDLDGQPRADRAPMMPNSLRTAIRSMATSRPGLARGELTDAVLRAGGVTSSRRSVLTTVAAMVKQEQLVEVDGKIYMPENKSASDVAASEADSETP